jgi:hypothetical protein
MDCTSCFRCWREGCDFRRGTNRAQKTLITPLKQQLPGLLAACGVGSRVQNQGPLQPMRGVPPVQQMTPI